MTNDIIERLRSEAAVVPHDVFAWLNPLLIEAADEIERLRSAAKLAHHEMRHTVAPRNSFTDALDALDAVLYPKQVL